MIIAVDVDGTVCDLLTEWLRWYNLDYEDKLKPSQITHWDVTKFVKPSCGKKIYNYLPRLYENAKIIKGSRDAVLELKNSGFRVIFVTAFSPATAGIKFNWLNKKGFGVDIKDYVETSDKGLINADFLIDDGFHNIASFNNNQIKYRVGVLYEQAWNKDIHYPVRVNNWEKIKDVLLNWENRYGNK